MLELDGDLERVEDALDAEGDLGADAIAWEEDDLLFVGRQEVAVGCSSEHLPHYHAVV